MADTSKDGEHKHTITVEDDVNSARKTSDLIGPVNPDQILHPHGQFRARSSSSSLHLLPVLQQLQMPTVFEFWWIVCRLWRLSSQVVVTSVLQQANQLITVLTVGHIGNVQFMAGATMGTTVLNICAFSLLYVDL